MTGGTSGREGQPDGPPESRAQNASEAGTPPTRARRLTPGAEGLAALLAANRAKFAKGNPGGEKLGPATPATTHTRLQDDDDFDTVEVTTVAERKGGDSATARSPSADGFDDSGRVLSEDSPTDSDPLIALFAPDRGPPKNAPAPAPAGRPSERGRPPPQTSSSGFEHTEVTTVGEPKARGGGADRRAPSGTFDPLESTAVSGPYSEPNIYIEVDPIADESAGMRSPMGSAGGPTEVTVRVKNPLIEGLDASSPRTTDAIPASGRIAALLAQARSESGRHDTLQARSSVAGSVPGLSKNVEPGRMAGQVSALRAAEAAQPARKRPNFSATLIGVPASELGLTPAEGVPAHPSSTGRLVFGQDRPSPDDFSAGLVGAAGAAQRPGSQTGGRASAVANAIDSQTADANSPGSEDLASVLRPSRAPRVVLFTVLGAAIAVFGTSAIMRSHRKANLLAGPASGPAVAPVVEPVVPAMPSEPAPPTASVAATAEPTPAAAAPSPSATSAPTTPPSPDPAAMGEPPPSTNAPVAGASPPSPSRAAIVPEEVPPSAAAVAKPDEASLRQVGTGAVEPTAGTEDGKKAGKKAGKDDPRLERTPLDVDRSPSNGSSDDKSASDDARPRTGIRSEARQAESKKGSSKRKQRASEGRARRAEPALEGPGAGQPSESPKLKSSGGRTVESDPDGTLPLTR